LPYILVEERRQHIIKAAIEVVAEEGLAGATTRRIAERAGAPLSALHYCFKNKNELIQVIAAEGAAMLRTFLADVDPTQGLEATLRGDIAAMWRWYQENAGLQLALLELGMNRIRRGGSPKDIYAMWGPYGRDTMREHFQAAARHDTRKLKLPVDEVVRFILHRFDGLILEFAASRDVKACQRQVDLLADAIVLLALADTTSNAPRERTSRVEQSKRTRLTAGNART
jgi:AcrR family transcriptional regulator